jgi:lipopolysaccharide transport protein LptA
MADIPADRLPPRAAFALLLALLGGSAQGAGPRGFSSEDITLDAASSDIDYRANMLRFRDVIIAQGDTRIEANEAEANGTGLKFDNSKWQFRGDVRIRFANGNLQSDQATVSFTGNRIAHAQISGSPAQFEQRVENLPQPARGRAGVIDYDLVGGNVRLSKDAWLSDGRSEISSQVLVYNLRDQKVRTENPQQPGDRPAAGTDPATSGSALGGKGRVHITIRPPQPEPEPAAPPAAAPTTPAP